MKQYIYAYEYEKNVNPTLNNVPLFEKNINDCDYGITFIDFANVFNVDYKSTTPNLLASFIKVSDNLSLNNNHDYNGTSHLFFVLNGSCELNIDDEIFTISEGDILITPFFNSLTIINKLVNDVNIYYINDSPLVNYLGNKPIKKIFTPLKI